MHQKEVSVIIPTYNRKDLLRETLSCLGRQTFPADHFEVIVVDDGSADGTQEIAKESFPFALRYIRQSNQGSAAARNTGARNAQGGILVFLDDDMILEPDYLAGLVEEHHRYSRIIGMGTVYPYVPADATTFARIYAQLPTTTNAQSDGTFVTFTDCVTNNLSVERSDFFNIGMMCDVAGDGPAWWGDVAFGYRAARLGFRFRRSAKAVCWHRDYSIRDLETACNRAQKAARMAVILLHKYPGIQPHLPMFFDKTPIAWAQDSPYLVVRKLARYMVSSPPAVWAMEQLVHLLEQYCPSPALLRPLYRWIIGGYIFRGFRDGLRKYGPIPSCKDEQVTLLLPRHSVSEEK